MRVIAAYCWYTEGRLFKDDFPDDPALVDWWRELPDDGFLAAKLFYDEHSGPVRLARNISGDEWYYIQPTVRGLVIDHGSRVTRDEIESRYPGAIIKRGKATTIDEIEQVNEAQGAARYWNDPPPIPVKAGCCDGN